VNGPESDPRHRARELLTRTMDFDAFDKGYPIVLAMRMVCRDNFDLLDELDGERSVRRALQQRCEEQQELLGKRLYDALGRP
jgi:hypothetical protein